MVSFCASCFDNLFFSLGLHCQINCGVDASSSTLPETLNYAINSSTKTEILRKYADFQEQKILSVQPNCASSMPVAMTDSVMCSDKGTYDKQELLTGSPEHAIMGSDTRSVQVKTHISWIFYLCNSIYFSFLSPLI